MASQVMILSTHLIPGWPHPPLWAWDANQRKTWVWEGPDSESNAMKRQLCVLSWGGGEDLECNKWGSIYFWTQLQAFWVFIWLCDLVWMALWWSVQLHALLRPPNPTDRFFYLHFYRTWTLGFILFWIRRKYRTSPSMPHHLRLK